MTRAPSSVHNAGPQWSLRHNVKVIYEKMFGIALDYAAETLARQDFAAPQIAQFDTADIERQLLSATREIKAAINASANVIIEKLESDKHEELIGRIQNVALAIRINDKAEILRSLMDMRISLGYAENRALEGKDQWQPALIMGKSAEFAALSVCLADTSHEKAELHEIVKQAKYGFLDAVIPNLLANKGKIDWDRLAVFVNSHDCGVQVADLRRVDAMAYVGKSPGEEEGEDIVACGAWWPGYVPDDHKLRVYTVNKKVGEVLPSNATIVIFEFEDGYFEKTSGSGESHLMKLYVNDGSYVQKGQKIARIRRKT